MKLAQALAVIQKMPPPGEGDYNIFLACGFMPLHLQTFLTAHLGLLMGNRPVAMRCGLYGDLAGNLDRAAEEKCDAVAVALEWSDLDPRLGYRHGAGWRLEQIADIVQNAMQQMERLQIGISRIARQKLLALALPSLPLPPLFLAPQVRGDSAALRLEAGLLQCASALAAEPLVRVLNPTSLDRLSPAGDRLDLASELRSGFPYTLSHASALGQLLAELLLPAGPKKGIITDLDNTLWNGILGEDGIEGISWDLDRKTYGHALYQGLLASLADSGVLLGVASKNDPELAARALRREDLLIPAEMLFPVEVSWGAKSEAVRRILQAWNVGPESVVFIDDSPLEVAEVAAAFPAMDCRIFPADNERGLAELLLELRNLFGKSTVTEEDRIRIGSLRAADGMAVAAAQTTPDDFLAGLEAEITLQINQPDQRAFELINKTNQFNLNGKRISETQWKARCEDPDHFLVAVAYQDKFGPLGTISVVGGIRREDELLADIWVLSCRAFSRRIEHQVLRELFARFGVESIILDFLPTERNGPLNEFLARISAEAPHPSLRLTKAVFLENCPNLYAKVSQR
ncbi:MAG: HAD-IIIC family phosphatase [Thermoguttaceae bacterium]|jgi:FkbH-like protein